MATNFSETFKMPTQTATNNGSNQGQQDKPKAQYWLNIGYEVDFTDAQGEDQHRFVSLPMGIPMDTTGKVAVNSSNESFAAFQSARNNLLEQLIAKAEAELAPGEETTVNLTVKLRRVKDDAEPINNNVNPFIRTLDL